MHPTTPAVDLVVPVKTLDTAKTRLRGAADRGIGEPTAHARLALALAHDTLAAVLAAARVRRVLVVSSDPVVAAELAAVGVEVVPDSPGSNGAGSNGAGLNVAYALGAGVLRRRDPGAVVGALPADLPALRPAELDAAIEAALAAFRAGATRVFVPDAPGTGTTLLLAAPGNALDPRFGPDSAAAHGASDAHRLPGAWPGLRRDVDTAVDLRTAAALGLGAHTRSALAAAAHCS